MPQLIAVEHDSQSVFYRCPAGAAEAQSRVRLRLYVKSDAEPKNIQVRVRFWKDRAGEEIRPLLPESPEKDKEYYCATIDMPEKGCLLWYYFIINIGDKTYYYGNNHDRLGGVGQITEHNPLSYQITVYNKGAHTPDWFKHSVMYQIFPDRFYRKGNEIIAKRGAVYHASWQDKPFYYKESAYGPIISYDFFGGNLAGIEEKLPYLKELGISVIYLNPIFESASNHRYDTSNYHRIDPILGSEADLDNLIAAAKQQGIRIMLDGVFSHTGDDSIYFNKYGHFDSVGAFQSQSSPYYEWYSFKDYPNNYESWWGFSTLPNVKEETPSYMNFIINDEDSVLHHWTKKGIGGWRLDVVDELPEKFTQSFYRELKDTNPEAVMLGEVWEDASNKNAYGITREYLCGQELDSAMNYPYRSVVIDFLLGYADSNMILRRINSLKENYPKENYYAMMNLLGSHDRERILTILGEAPSCENTTALHQSQYVLDPERLRKGLARMKLAVVWQMTFPGVPSVYYGDEISMQGYRDPFSRGAYQWHDADEDMREWHKKLIKLRNDNIALQTGELLPLCSTGDVYGYVRSIIDGKDVFGQEAENATFIVLLNRSQEPRHVNIDVRDMGYGSFVNPFDENDKIRIKRGRIEYDVPAFTGKVYRLIPESCEAHERQCGVLMPITSFPSRYGVGDLGPEAYKFVDFLAAAKQGLWQILPLNPTDFAHSPYASPSAFAGNTLLISLDKLVEMGYADKAWLDELQLEYNATNKTDYKLAEKLKPSFLKKAGDRFFAQATAEQREDFDTFCKDNSFWLEDYAVFKALHDLSGECWNCWPDDFKHKKEGAMAVANKLLGEEIRQERFEQYMFSLQWTALRKYTNEKGIRIIGDMPIFVSLDSADAWSNQSMFKLDQKGRPYKIAGVPPDDFCKHGQLWGNPQYDWKVMEKEGYGWWLQRLKQLYKQVDIVRIDHFRGFESYWEIEGDAETAEQGAWRKGPGKPFFDLIKKELDNPPIIAEDLGYPTEEVEELLEHCGFPGMKLLSFELHFNERGRIDCVEPENSVVYTGTHDNDTIVGWLNSMVDKRTRDAIAELFKLDAAAVTDVDICKGMVERCYASAARIAIIPVWDILALDGTNRMNLPGTADGNWSWMLLPDRLTEETAEWLKKLAEKYKR